MKRVLGGLFELGINESNLVTSLFIIFFIIMGNFYSSFENGFFFNFYLEI